MKHVRVTVWSFLITGYAVVVSGDLTEEVNCNMVQVLTHKDGSLIRIFLKDEMNITQLDVCLTPKQARLLRDVLNSEELSDVNFGEKTP